MRKHDWLKRSKRISCPSKHWNLNLPSPNPSLLTLPHWFLNRDERHEAGLDTYPYGVPPPPHVISPNLNKWLLVTGDGGGEVLAVKEKLAFCHQEQITEASQAGIPQTDGKNVSTEKGVHFIFQQVLPRYYPLTIIDILLKYLVFVLGYMALLPYITFKIVCS